MAVAVAVAAVMAVAACGTPNPPPAPEEIGQLEYPEAVERFRKAPAQGVRLQWLISEVPYSDVRVVQQGTDLTVDTLTRTADGVPAATEQRVLGEQHWLQLKAWLLPLTGCWLDLTSDGVEEDLAAIPEANFDGFELLDATRVVRGLPTSQGYRGELDFKFARLLVTKQLAEEFKLPRRGAVPVTVQLVKGLPVAIELTGEDLEEALREVKPRAARNLPETIDVYRWSANYSTGEPREIEAPSGDLVVTGEQVAAGEGCRSET